MIINLVGPPAIGKSTFAARFVLEHPEFQYCSIDNYRIAYEDEDLAWHKLTQDIIKKRNVVLETCGLSYRLRDIFNNETIRRRPMFTVALTGDLDTILERLTTRQKKEIPYPYHYTEQETVQFVLEHLDDSVAPIDYTLDVTHSDPDQVYRLLCARIARKRILTFGDRTRRKEHFDGGVKPLWKHHK